MFLSWHFSKVFLPNDCRSLLQGHISFTETVAVRRLQHLHPSFQPCCLDHLPRHDGCPVLRAARGSESRTNHWCWLSTNSAAVCQWFHADSNRPRLPRRLALIFLHFLSENLQVPRTSTTWCLCRNCDRLWEKLIFFLSIQKHISENLFSMPVDFFLPTFQTVRSLLLVL